MINPYQGFTLVTENKAKEIRERNKQNTTSEAIRRGRARRKIEALRDAKELGIDLEDI